MGMNWNRRFKIMSGHIKRGTIKLGTKISIGFGIVLLLLIIAAAAGFNGLTKVVRETTDAIATGDLIRTMYESRQQEKNFIIRKDPSYIKAVLENAQMLKKEIETIKARSADPKIQQQLDDMLKMADKYRQAFDTYVTLEDSVKEADQAMVKSARQMEAAAKAILEADRAKFNRLIAQGADLSQLNHIMIRAENAEAIIQLVLQCRRHEKNFLIRKEVSYFTKVNGIIDKNRRYGKGERTNYTGCKRISSGLFQA